MNIVDRLYTKNRGGDVVKRVVVLIGITAVLYSQSAFSQNTIDGVTAASGARGLTIRGGKAYADSATITWWDYYNNGQVHDLLWGTTESYGNTKSLKPFTARTDVTTTIKGLQPNTKYYAAIHRTYPSKGSDVTTKFQFTTTAAASTNKPPVITTAPAVTCTTGTTRTFTLTATDADNDPVTFVISGQPNWVTLANAVLTLKPVTGSTNGSVRVIAQDGKGGADSMNITLTVVASTAVRAVVQKTTTGHTLSFGTDRVLFPTSGDAFVDVSLHTLAGARMLQKRIAVKSGSVELATAGVTPGVYVLQLKNSTFSLLQRVTLRE